MSVPTAYLTTAKNVKDVFASMQKAGVPKRFTYEFLKQLGFASSGDRPVISVMKALRFLDDSGVPTERYRRFREPAQARGVLAEAMREAYADVFTIDQAANDRTTNDLKGIFARLSEKGDAVSMKMATTFKTLADMADFTVPPAAGVAPEEAEAAEPPQPDTTSVAASHPERAGAITVHHDVHVHLPVTTDIAVYDAIFRSLRENLQ